MFIATVVVSVLLAVALVASALAKFSAKPDQIENLTGLGVPRNLIPVLGALEVAGAIGLVVGLFWWPIGVAAAIGVILYFAGAVITHLRAHDRQIAPALVIGLVAVAALVLRLLSI